MQQASRWDAEYYQGKYDAVEGKIKAYSGGWKTVGDVAILHNTNVVPASGMQKYIELANIGTAGDITGCTEAPGKDLPSRARRRVHAGDIIVSSIEGSLQSCAMISDEYDGAMCSTGFFVLEAQGIQKEVLLLLLKSDALQLLLKKECSGTILTAYDAVSLMRLPLPLLPDPVQQQIAQAVQEAASLRRESAAMLDEAKRAVEQEIEGNADS